MRPCPPVVVENPILNSPFLKPTRHLEMTNGRVTGAVLDGRRASAHIEPVPPSRQGRGQQPDLDFDEADFTRRGKRPGQSDPPRGRCQARGWLLQHHAHNTAVARPLDRPDAGSEASYGQLEAVETAIDLTEVAARIGDHDPAKGLRLANGAHNAGLNRLV